DEFLLKLKRILPEDHRVRLHIDIVGNLARSGNWFHDLRKDHRLLEKFSSEANFPSVISVDTTLYQNAGATIPQELAYSLAHANEYLNHLAEGKWKKSN